MENNESLSLKTRRILVVFYFLTLLVSWILIFVNGKDKSNEQIYYVLIVLLIINAIIDKYIKAKSDVFKIANNKIHLDERLSYVRIKAQRDAYFFTLIIFMLALTICYKFLKSDPFLCLISTLGIVLSLIMYLPAMLIAWQEKEV